MEYAYLILLVVVGTTIWVGYDAHANQVSISPKKPYSINTGAVAWVFSCLLFWIAVFPYYLIRRSKVLAEKKSLAESSGKTSDEGVRGVLPQKKSRMKGALSKAVGVVVVLGLGVGIYFLVASDTIDIGGLLRTETDYVAAVKGGTLDFDNTITVGDAFDKYPCFRSVEWKTFEAEGRQIVEARGFVNLNSLESSVLDGLKSLGVGAMTCVVQFAMGKDGKSFKIHAGAYEYTTSAAKTDTVNLPDAELTSVFQSIYGRKSLK